MTLLILATSALGSEKIEGAFGLKLGDPFQPKNAAVSKFGFAAGYEFTPEKPNSALTTYFVYITPNSHLIYQIVAVGTAEDSQSASNMSKKIRAIVGRKYEDTPTNDESIEQGARRVEVVKRESFVSQQISKTQYSFAVFYTDTRLQSQASQERSENERKELLKDADTTGL